MIKADLEGGKSAGAVPVTVARTLISRAQRIITIFGASLFCMGNSISLLSAGADYMRGVMNDERQ
jgi:hypothetical protein